MKLLAQSDDGQMNPLKSPQYSFSCGTLLCWLLVASVGQNWLVRTPQQVLCSLPISHRKRTISGIHALIVIKGYQIRCRACSRSSRS